MREDRFTNTPEDAARYEDMRAETDAAADRPTLAELERDDAEPWPIQTAMFDERPKYEPEPRSCPDCEQGKHRNCTDTAWDNELDDLVPCPCAEAGHKP